MVSLNDLDWVKLAYSNQNTVLDLELDISHIIIITFSYSVQVAILS